MNVTLSTEMHVLLSLLWYHLVITGTDILTQRLFDNDENRESACGTAYTRT